MTITTVVVQRSVIPVAIIPVNRGHIAKHETCHQLDWVRMSFQLSFYLRMMITYVVVGGIMRNLSRDVTVVL